MTEEKYVFLLWARYFNDASICIDSEVLGVYSDYKRAYSEMYLLEEEDPCGDVDYFVECRAINE